MTTAVVSLTSDLKRKKWMREGLVQAASKSFWAPMTGSSMDSVVYQANNENSAAGHTVVSDFDGKKFFYTQILTGDRADNIVGLYGVGPKKAEKMLADCETEADMYEECLHQYGGEEDRVIENARLLWLRREPDQLWEPPKCVTDQD